MKVNALLSKILDDSVIITTFGSGPLKTFLPESDIDITILFTEAFLKNKTLDTPSYLSMKDLTLLKDALEEKAEDYNIEDVSIINASVKIIKMQWDEVPIDISFNQVGGVTTLKYLESVDKLVDNDHLFKKAILLIKAWWMYEGRILGSHIGCLSSYTLEVFIIHLLIKYSKEIHSPIDIFFKFFLCDWSQYAVSIFEFVDIYDARNDPDLVHNFSNFDFSEDSSISEVVKAHGKLMKKYQQSFLKMWERYKVSTSIETHASFNHYFNIIDPICPSNNLGKSISNFNKKRIQRILKSQKGKLQEYVNIKESITSQTATVQEIIQYKHQLYGIFNKIYSIMEQSKCEDPSQWMQMKLKSPHILPNYNQIPIYPMIPNQYQSGYYYESNPFINYAPQEIHPMKIDQQYDSDLLKGEIMEFEEKEDSIWSELKDQKRKSPFASTWKSTENSHQENIPNSNTNIQEEIKHADCIFKNSKFKSLSVKPLRKRKIKQVEKLDCIPKTREPLSVRNTNNVCQNIELPNSTNHLLSTLN